MDVDLTLLSSNFPELPEPQVARDNLVAWLKSMFGADRKVIVVEGPVGAGKSALLAQFAKSNPSRCLSFFITRTYSTSRPRDLMIDLAEQMGQVVGGDASTVGVLDSDRLETVFHDLHTTLARHARRSADSYYIVVDGLEWLSEHVQADAILKLIPIPPRQNIYILLSADRGTQLPWDVFRWPIPFYSRSDTEFYLAGTELTADQIGRVHQVSGGMPGYLAAVRRLLADGIAPDELLADAPSVLDGLFQMEWRRVGDLDDGILTALAVLAQSTSPLRLDDLATVTKLEPRYLRDGLDQLSFVHVDREQRLTFVSDAYRGFVARELESRRGDAVGLLVEHYQQDPFSQSSLTSLPPLLADSGYYSQLKALVTGDYLATALRRTGDTACLRRTLQLVTQHALVAKDYDAVLHYVLAGAMLRSLTSHPVAESEVSALVALEEYDEAYRLADQALLVEDRLQLLARVCTKRQQAGLSTPEDVLLRLEHMADAVDVVGVRDRVIEIAADLFELSPTGAIRLVERAVGEGASERLVDMARAQLALKLEAESHWGDTEVVKSRITNPGIRDFAAVHSARASSLSAGEVIAEAAGIGDTSGRLHLLSAWCNANRNNPSAHVVVDEAVRSLFGSPEYAVSMRTLRQLCEPLKACSTADVMDLVRKIDILKSTAIASPQEELTRLELALAAAEVRQSQGTVPSRVQDAYVALDTIAELDIRCYCLVRILVSLPDIDPGDSLELLVKADERLKSDYEALLNDAADHLAVTRRLLQPLVLLMSGFFAAGADYAALTSCSGRSRLILVSRAVRIAVTRRRPLTVSW